MKRRPFRLVLLAVAFGLGSVFSNREHGELIVHLTDQRYERIDDDPFERDPRIGWASRLDGADVDPG